LVILNSALENTLVSRLGSVIDLSPLFCVYSNKKADLRGLLGLIGSLKKLFLLWGLKPSLMSYMLLLAYFIPLRHGPLIHSLGVATFFAFSLDNLIGSLLFGGQSVNAIKQPGFTSLTP